LKKLGVYCGSFNPIHNGHIEIIEKVVNQGLVDEVLIIPTGNYWHKQNLLPLEDRINMIKLCNIPNLTVDTTHNNIQYTIDILDDLSSTIDDELCFIVGADNLEGLPKWNNFKNLIKYNFIIVPRDNIDIEHYMSLYNKENYTVLDYQQNDISSSNILHNLKSDYNEIKDMLPKKVLDYLTKIT